MSEQQLYIEQLKSCIGDLLACGKHRWGWRDIWQGRVARARYLLNRRVKTPEANKPQTLTESESAT